MRFLLAFCSLLVHLTAEGFVPLSHAQDQLRANHSRYVYPNKNGRLIYSKDEQSNVIADFSYAGYRGGGVALPLVQTVRELRPQVGEDDTQRIQIALDALAQLPLDENGFRGGLLLRKGRYRLTSTLKIPADGIVLRGEGQSTDGTVIRAWGGKFDTAILLEGKDQGARFDLGEQEITDDYVPAGTKTLQLKSAQGFVVGDSVVVIRPATEQWLAEVKGDQLGWGEGYTYRYERTITAIEGNRIWLDIPLIEPISRQLGPGRVAKYRYPNRLKNVGVEGIRLENGGQGVVMKKVQNAWVRNVTVTAFMYSCATIWHDCKSITVEDCAYLDPVGPIKGGYRYGFNLCGQLTLVQRCYARQGRHDFVMHLHGRGPNVFLDCLADEAHSDSGPHHRWSVGTLYDNVSINGNGLTAKYAGSRGTGHGWTGAQMVFYNCRANYLNIQDPPTAQNYCIGCQGKKSAAKYRGTQGIWDSWRKPVSPRSLYLAQLRDRLGEQAVDNVTTPEQRAGPINAQLRVQLGR